MTQATLTGEEAKDHVSPFEQEEGGEAPEYEDRENGQESLARFAAQANHQTLDAFGDDEH